VKNSVKFIAGSYKPMFTISVMSKPCCVASVPQVQRLIFRYRNIYIAGYL